MKNRKLAMPKNNKKLRLLQIIYERRKLIWRQSQRK